MKQADINQHLLQEIESAQKVIARHESDHPAYVVGVLRATLAGMAGLSDLPTHQSCFSSEVTKAIKQLLEIIDQH